MNKLRRTLGLPAAVITGVASMLGMAIFTVWTPVVAYVQGVWILIALLLAGVVAAANATSAARLAAALPESGGVYAYARRWLNTPLALLAGYSFWISKTASSSAAALAIGAYLFPDHQRLVALTAIGVALAINALGLKRTVWFLGASAAVVITVIMVTSVDVIATHPLEVAQRPEFTSVISASAYFFIVFAGYARLATLGAEVRRPERTIPWAMAISMLIIAVVTGITAVAVASVNPTGDASLVSVNPQFATALQIAVVLSAGGSLLSLIAGTSRTVFAMAAHGHAPQPLLKVSNGIPQVAQAFVAVGIAALTAVGGISFGIGLAATSILTYYAIAHVAALRAKKGRLIPILGLSGCLLLGLWPLWVNL